MEIGVRKEYVITTKGTPLHSHCQVREWDGKEWVGGLEEEGRGEVDSKKNARVVVAVRLLQRGLVQFRRLAKLCALDFQISYSLSFPYLNRNKAACLFPVSCHGDFQFFHHAHYRFGGKGGGVLYLYSIKAY